MVPRLVASDPTFHTDMEDQSSIMCLMACTCCAWLMLLEVIFCNYWIIIKTNYLFNIFVTSTEFTKHWILFIVHQINPLSFVMCLSLGDIVKLPSLEAYVSKTIRYTISKWILIGTTLDHHEVLLLNNAISVLYPMYFKCKKFIQLQTKKCTHEFITLQ